MPYLITWPLAQPSTVEVLKHDSLQRLRTVAKRAADATHVRVAVAGAADVRGLSPTVAIALCQRAERLGYVPAGTLPVGQVSRAVLNALVWKVCSQTAMPLVLVQRRAAP